MTLAAFDLLQMYIQQLKMVIFEKEQDLLGQVSRLRKREGQKYVNFNGKS